LAFDQEKPHEQLSRNCHLLAILLRSSYASVATRGGKAMTDDDYARKLDELDHLLNDPDMPMEPARVWSLLAEISHRDLVEVRAETGG
jgi:hypothetical protein